jgi:hypothetical protein
MAGLKDEVLEPKGYQQLVNPAAATALTVPAGTKLALFNVSAGTIVFRDDGVDPTAGIGIILASPTNLWYTGKINKVKVIQATSGTLNVAYYA